MTATTAKTQATAPNCTPQQTPVVSPGEVLAPSDSADAGVVLAEALTGVRAELQRVDAKAGSLFGAAGIILAVAGITGGTRSDLAPATEVMVWGTTGALATAVIALALAMRPRLCSTGGRYGILAYTPGTTEQLTERAHQLATEPDAPSQARELAGLARSLRVKYRLIRTAIDVAIGGPILAAVVAGVVHLAS